MSDAITSENTRWAGISPAPTAARSATAARVITRPELADVSIVPSGEGLDVVRLWRPFPREVADVVCMYKRTRTVALHTHEQYQITLALDAHAVVDGRGRRTVLPSGGIAVVDPLDSHGADAEHEGRWRARVLLVGTSLMDEVVRELGEPPGRLPSFPRTVIEDARLSTELALVSCGAPNASALEVETRLFRALVRLAQGHAGRGRSEATRVPRHVTGVARVRDFLRAHVVDSVSLTELSVVSGLSKYYLLRAFRRAMGLSPHEYQMQLRLARARRLIELGQAPSVVAYSAGFADQSHLTRRFKGYFGYTPARYARACEVGPEVERAAATA
jgi:AraC-like DNA-binding protein